MRWKLFAILWLYFQLRIVAEVYTTGFSGALTPLIWVLSFPVCIALLCYAFKFPVGDAKYWRGFSWLCTALSLVLSAEFGQRLRAGSANLPVGSPLVAVVALALLVFIWLGVWRYGRDPQIWGHTSNDKPPIDCQPSKGQPSAATIIRAVFPLPVYVISLLVFAPRLIVADTAGRLILCAILAIFAAMAVREYKVLRQSFWPRTKPQTLTPGEPQDGGPGDTARPASTYLSRILLSCR